MITNIMQIFVKCDMALKVIGGHIRPFLDNFFFPYLILLNLTMIDIEKNILIEYIF